MSVWLSEWYEMGSEANGVILGQVTVSIARRGIVLFVVDGLTSTPPTFTTIDIDFGLLKAYDVRA